MTDQGVLQKRDRLPPADHVRLVAALESLAFPAALHDG